MRVRTIRLLNIGIFSRMEATPHGDSPVSFDDFSVLAPFSFFFYGVGSFV